MTLNDQLGPTLLAERYGTDPAWMWVEGTNLPGWRVAEQARHAQALLDATAGPLDQDGQHG